MSMTIAIVKLLDRPLSGLLVLALLSALSWIDLRSCYVPPAIVLAIGFLALPGITLPDMFFSFGVYTLLMVLSALTSWSIGGGDIKLLAALALYLRPGQFAHFLLPLGAGCLSVILWAFFQKVPKDRQIPFVPFICAAFILWLFWQFPAARGG